MYPNWYQVLTLNIAPTVNVVRSQSVPLTQNFGSNPTPQLVRCINVIGGFSVVLESSGAATNQQLFIVTTSAGQAQLSADNGALIGGKAVYTVPAFSSVNLIWNGSAWTLQ